ncbi:hypothetical protein SCHAM137S_01749 [Streptomyces chartreusis]
MAIPEQGVASALVIGDPAAFGGCADVPEVLGCA